MELTDTSPEAQRVYYGRLAEMTPSEKSRITAWMYSAGNSMQRANFRRLFPLADEEEITYRVACARFGEEFSRKAYRRG